MESRPTPTDAPLVEEFCLNCPIMRNRRGFAISVEFITMFVIKEAGGVELGVIPTQPRLEVK